MQRQRQRRRDRGLPPQIERVALRKLTQLDRSRELCDLMLPPGNCLEACNRAEQRSIRVNDQWCICFYWRGEDAHDVEIVDYH